MSWKCPAYDEEGINIFCAHMREYSGAMQMVWIKLIVNNRDMYHAQLRRKSIITTVKARHWFSLAYATCTVHQKKKHVIIWKLI